MNNTRHNIIAITGGIGAGKSIVSQILRRLGYFVYDCDENAKRLMDTSDSIKDAIKNRISSDVVTDNKIDRKKLSEIVFHDNEKLLILNSIVHQSVIKDILETSQKYQLMFVETAILYQSHIDKIVAKVWEVTAPIETRITRVIKRNNFSRNQVIDRINSQNFTPDSIHPNTLKITNDDIHPVLPQVLRYLEEV